MQVTIPAEVEETKRPTAVSVIGWLWLVVGVLLFGRSMLNVVLWKIAQAQSPELLQEYGQRAERLWILGQFFRHAVAINVLEGMFGAAAGLIAWGFLQLKSWARPALEAASWILLAFLSVGVAFFFKYWPVLEALAPDPGLTSERRLRFVYGAFGVAGLLIAGTLVMLGLLRSRGVRAAFSGS